MEGASFSLTQGSSSQALYRLRRVLFAKTHRALTPLLLASKSNPLTLGFDLGKTGASEKHIVSVNIHRNNKIRTCSDGRQVRIFAFLAKWDLSLLSGLGYGVCFPNHSKGINPISLLLLSSRKRFAGLRLDGMRALEGCVFFANARQLVASFVSLATSFFVCKKLIVRSRRCSLLPNRTRLRWASIWENRRF